MRCKTLPAAGKPWLLSHMTRSLWKNAVNIVFPSERQGRLFWQYVPEYMHGSKSRSKWESAVFCGSGRWESF